MKLSHFPRKFGVGSLTTRHSVALARTARVLVLDNAILIDAFHEDYAVRHYERPVPAWRSDCEVLRQPLDWAKVAEHYDGLIIAPYQWSRRYDGPSWYYGWDCASGCIWNLDAIAAVEPAPPLQLLTGAENETRRRVDHILSAAGRPEAQRVAESILLWDIAETFAPRRVIDELTRLVTEGRDIHEHA